MSKEKKILDEDEFVECLDKIIERDFFPDYEKLKDQNDYLEASSANNFEEMRKIALKYSTKNNKTKNPLQAHTSSPASFVTPAKSENGSTNEEFFHMGSRLKDESESFEEESVADSDKKFSLDKFMSKYTSEDSESFKSIIKKSNEDLRLKNAWMYEAEEKHKQMVKDLLQIEDSQKDDVLAITDGKQTDIKDETTVVPKKPRDPPLINTWEYKAKNHLMYYPEEHHGKDDDLFKKPKLIVHSNTRFNSNPFKEGENRDKIVQAFKENQVLAGEKVGHDGKSILPDESPKVNGYSYVSDSPAVHPGVADSPMMTWGVVNSTPAILDRGSQTPTPGPVFHFPEESARDKLAHQMVEEVMKKKKGKKEKALKQMKSSMRGTPQQRLGSACSSDRINTFSPAARKLFNKRFGRGSDKALRASYTPSSSYRRTPRSLTPIVKTPQPTTPLSQQGTPSKLSSNITDNLLKLPKKERKKASDFF